MSVVTQQARRRWAVVAACVAVLLSLPVASSAVASLGREPGAAAGAQALLRGALASAAVPHSGLAVSTGNLGLPDLREVGDVTARLGGTTRTRVWWAGPQSWRVDVLSATGEQGTYESQGRTVFWDYERDRLTEVVGRPQLRLPRADDLIPPQLARRLLAGVGPRDRLSAIAGRRGVAGLRAEGLRVTPGDARSTIGHIDVWVDPVRRLPVALDVVDVAGTTALSSSFVDLDLAAPPPEPLRVPSAPGADHDVTDELDPLTRVQQYADFRLPVLPGSLAGIASSDPIVGRTGTYGSGLVRFVVVPLPERLAEQVLGAVRSGGGVDLDAAGGESLSVGSGLLNLVVSRRADGRRAFLVAGPVQPDLLADVTAELLELPAAGR